MTRREQLIRDLAKHIIKCNKEDFDSSAEPTEYFGQYGVTHKNVEIYMKELLNDVVDEVEKEQRFLSEFLYEW